MTTSLVACRVQIRPPRTADAQQLSVLNRQLGYATEIEELVSRINKLSELHEHFVAVAEVDGTVVGWVQAEHRFSMETGDKAELVGLIVGAATRRSGVGRLLVQAAENWATDRGLLSVVVRSNVIRPESHSFYRRIGYRQSKTQHVYAKPLQRKSGV
jgi:N-acetylglutamate synthase-like GNAT family acetyltransferase